MWTYKGVKVHWLGHDSFVLDGSKVIMVDPFNAKGNFKADAILITHEHFDHLSKDDIKKFSVPSTKLVAPKICEKELAPLKLETIYVTAGTKVKVAGATVEAFPAYNLNKFREPGKVFHPKEEGRVGYIVTLDGVRFYHAGDTDAITEMKAVDVDVALLPVSGTYVMTAEEAAGAAKMIRAKTFVPMHFGRIVGNRADAERFKTLVKGEVVILDEE
jgi:L-ascorbate metabolism protein UlaG (beta-lactamase superfamily)